MQYCYQDLTAAFIRNALPTSADSGQIVIVVSLGQNLALQSALSAAFGEDDGIGVEPVETLSLDVPVSHLIVDLTIVSAIEVHV